MLELFGHRISANPKKYKVNKHHWVINKKKYNFSTASKLYSNHSFSITMFFRFNLSALNTGRLIKTNTLSCWEQFPLLFLGMFTSILALTIVMLEVTRHTCAIPSCMTMAPRSACLVASHAFSKQGKNLNITPNIQIYRSRNKSKILYKLQLDSHTTLKVFWIQILYIQKIEERLIFTMELNIVCKYKNKAYSLVDLSNT